LPGRGRPLLPKIVVILSQAAARAPIAFLHQRDDVVRASFARSALVMAAAKATPLDVPERAMATRSDARRNFRRCDGEHEQDADGTDMDAPEE
jgi:hypothetical protein